MKNLTPEMIEKAKAAKSAEKLLEIAKANNIEMTADEAATYFAQLAPKSGELSDDDLDAVAVLEVERHFQRVEVFRIEDRGQCSAVDGTVSLHGIASDVLGVRNLFDKHKYSVAHSFTPLLFLYLFNCITVFLSENICNLRLQMLLIYIHFQ